MMRSAALMLAVLLLAAACAAPTPQEQRDPWNNRASIDGTVRPVTPLG